MITEEQTILEINKQLQSVLEIIKIDALEPIDMGRIMKSVNTILNSSLEFVEKNIGNLEGGQAIKNATSEFQNRYNAIDNAMKSTINSIEDFEEWKVKSENIEKKFNDLQTQINNTKSVIETETENYHKLDIEYQEYVKRLEEWQIALDDIRDKHSKNVETYKLHFAANDDILQNIVKMDGYYAQEQINGLVSSIKEKLDIFDDKLKSTLASRNKLSIAALEKEKHKFTN